MIANIEDTAEGKKGGKKGGAAKAEQWQRDTHYRQKPQNHEQIYHYLPEDKLHNTIDKQLRESILNV